jgi:hypothetical protein
MFSVLALKCVILHLSALPCGLIHSYLSSVANKTVVVPSGSAPPASSSGVPSAKSNAGAIAGGVVGGVAVLLLLGGVAIFLRRWWSHRDVNDGLATPRPYHAPPNIAAVSGGSSVAAKGPLSNPLTVPPLRVPGAGFSYISPKATPVSGVPGYLAPELISPPVSSRQPPNSSGVGLRVSRGTEELRSDVERLRHEFDQLRATQGVPPPNSSGVGSRVLRGTEELRSDVEQLRHEVEQLRATQGVSQQAPPEYHNGSWSGRTR